MLRLLGLLFLVFITGAFSSVSAQTQSNDNWVTAYVHDGDTIPVVFMNMFVHTAPRTFASKKERKKYKRLEYNITKVYPYAQKAAELLRKYENELANETNERERKKYYKKVEKELRSEYEEELMNLTMTQGRLLIKLIDRQTGETSYELVQHLRGDFTAFLFQGLARLFGHDLKDDYDPTTEDKLIEDIVALIESGELKLASR